MKLRNTINIIKSDLYRYSGEISLKAFLKVWATEPGFKVTFPMRCCDYLKQKNRILSFLPLVFFYILFKRCRIKYGIDLKLGSNIGGGFYIGHFNCIVISRQAVIGRNVNVSHGVTIGRVNRGKRKGFPTIGNNVYIGAGAKVLGNIKVGNNVAIGANSVVTKHIPNNAVAVGIPAKVISLDGSDGYINNINYEHFFC